MNLDDTVALNRIVAGLRVPPASFFSGYFSAIEQTDNEYILFDKAPSGRRLVTPLVSPLAEGKVIKELGYTMGAVAPAYFKDLRKFDPNRYFKRTLGETIGGNLTPLQRLAGAVNSSLTEMLQMWQRRKEAMAAEIIRTGAISLSGENSPPVNVDFQRDGALTVALAGAAKWSATTSDPLGDIEAGGQLIFDKSQRVATDVIMHPNVWKTIRPRLVAAYENPSSTDTGAKSMLVQLDMGQASYQQAKADLAPRLTKEAETKLVAVYGDYRLLTYAAKYTDPETGATIDMLPDGYVVMAADIDGVQFYASIRDLEANMEPIPYFVKSWEKRNPSARFILGQSACLLVPYLINASYSLKVY